MSAATRLPLGGKLSMKLTDEGQSEIERQNITNKAKKQEPPVKIFIYFRRYRTMVKMRLVRLGDKRNPIYRVVVADARKAASGLSLIHI